MTIDEARTSLKKERRYALHENKRAFDIAIDTMRKYQKIKQILDNWENSGEEEDPINIIDNIEEVLEDGNNTTNTENH